MDHAEARELLELASAEPRGFERLMAGDTPEAAALAGHLAGCDVCAADMERLRRAGAMIREVVRATPPAELRERTLAYVAELGRDRSGPAAVEASRTAAPARGRSSDRTVRRVAALAAVLIAAIAGTALVFGVQRQAELDSRSQEIAALERIAQASFRVAAEPDAHHVALSATEGGDASGRLVFSPRTRELVVVATGLPEPPAGREFRCWVEYDGQRYRVGRMFFADDLSFWVGPVEEVGSLPADARFGVSLVDAAGDSLDGPPTLGGAL